MQEREVRLSFTKMFSLVAVVCIFLLGMMFVDSASAYAKTDFSNAAPSLIVNILNPDGTVTFVHEYKGEPAAYNDDGSVKYYTYPELEALQAKDEPGDPIPSYYATIDAMPAGVGTKAYGVTISALINDAKKYNSNISWQSGRKLVMYPTDAATTPYQGTNYYTYDFLSGQDRYYFPNLVSAFKVYYDDHSGVNPDDLKNAYDDPVAVEPMLAFSSYQERWANDDILKSTTNPVTIDGVESFRFCMGLTLDEAQQGTANKFSSTNKFARWVYRIDVGPVNGPSLTADSSDAILGQSMDITFKDNEEWRDHISTITLADADGNSKDLTKDTDYTIDSGKLTLNSSVFTKNGSYKVTIVSDGFMNATVTQNIGIAPTLRADTTDNTEGNAIDINFSDNASWDNAVTGVKVGDTNVSGYTLTEGKLTIPGTYFTAAGDYVVTVTAANYNDASVTQNILKLPPVINAGSARAVGQPFSLTFDNEDWCAQITDIKVASSSKLANCTIEKGKITFDDTVFPNVSSYTVTVKATGYADAKVVLPPVITADTTDNTVGKDIIVTYPAYQTSWKAKITGVTVNGKQLSSSEYSLATDNQISVPSSLFPDPGDYTIAVQATGYADAIALQNITGVTSYGITVNSSPGGSVSADKATAAAGDTVTLTVAPDSGKQLKANSLAASYNDGSARTLTLTQATGNTYIFTMPAYDVSIAADFEEAPVTPKYTVTGVADDIYSVSKNPDGIAVMTVKESKSGFSHFKAAITAPSVGHGGNETVVFVHLRNGGQLSMNTTIADFDTINEAQAGFNVQAGDVVKVYIVDAISNATDFNPTLLQ